ncbi:uncharacterized protein IL334_005612 [Kwoniella shivajii]|uniref:Uncharacterized protein n=1 Tax=Kwoniella shivajii TaxID=564305 RepID=A0ABZ1D3M3_9TREE|nr:hypothetical protein IL334_005612 [Kwoniella shivajii]
MPVSGSTHPLTPGPLPTPPNLGDHQKSSSSPTRTASAATTEFGLNRPPTLHFPSLHLGSFDTLSISNSPQPFSPTSSNHHSNSSTGSPSRREFGGVIGRSGEAGPSNIRGTEGQTEKQEEVRGDTLSVEPTRSASHSSRSSHRLHKGPIPPPLPPPTMALPPLPTISPISPFGPSSSSYLLSQGLQSTMFQPPSSSSSSSSNAQQQQQFSEGRRELPTIPPRARPLGHSLTIHVPGSLDPSPTDQEGNPIHSPILKHSPGIARRRTVVENTNTQLGSPVRVSGIAGRATPPRDSSPTRANQSPPVERGSVIMPQPRPSPAIDQKRTLESSGRLEKKRSTADLKNVSPTSPTTKRSLPRPPKIDTTLPRQESNPDITQNLLSTAPIQTVVPTDVAIAIRSRQHLGPATASILVDQRQSTLALPHTAPVPSSSWPPLNIARSPTSSKPPVIPHDPAPKPSIYQKHQANKSASFLPVVAGLADAGPFAGAFVKPVQAGPNGVGLGRPSGQMAAGQTRGVSGKPQEEVCLECMMRDRDLADVIVQGEGVWERSSDGDWKDLEWREEALLKPTNPLEDRSSSIRSIGGAADDFSDNSDSTTFSPPSTGNSAEDAQLRRNIDERRRRRSAVKAKKREAERRIAREVGWRGFKWEEGEAGEGLPRGFRGTKGGKLTEEGIRAVMAKFPSASAHRYQTLQIYLRQQWFLVQEVRAEAQKLGRFAFPDEIMPSSSTASSHDGQSIPRGAQSSALGWSRQRNSDMNGQIRGVYTPTRNTPQLSVVRPSPSTPANLTASAPAPRTQVLQRPLTHFIPDREPSLGAPRTPLYNSPMSGSTRTRHGKQGSSPGLIERSPPPTGTYEESNEELWSPDEEGGANLRPFSFAVRAGATAARDGGSDGHGRRSLWGRFGGSVTSLFGGSQNGSGSMMDMHLGLDSDRRNRTSSYTVNPYPRAVSLASPTRPSFFGRESRSSSDVNVDMPRMSRAISQSRLSQMRLDDEEEEDDEDDKPKKKGIKGFFKKMKPKGGRSKSKPELLVKQEDDLRREQPQPDTPLAPPPPLSYLVGNRKHSRNRSGSSSSVLTDGQDSTQGRRYSGSLPYGMRSVSAPMNGTASSSGGSLSASPTSSKFATSGPKRESYASAQRRSLNVNEMGEPEFEKRQSGMEMLSNSGSGRGGIYSSPEPQTIYDEPSSIYNKAGMGYPNPNFRPHNKTTSSLSNSSVTMAIETPPPAMYNPSSFFNQQQAVIPPPSGMANTVSNHNTPIVKSPSGPLSPNRFKNLPPLPPGKDQPSMGITSSPDSFAAAFPDQEINLTGTVHDPRYLSSKGQTQPPSTKNMIDFSTPIGSPASGRYQPSPRNQQQQQYGYPQPQSQPQLHVNTNLQSYQQHQQQQQQYPSAHARALATGRASFDQPSPRARMGTANERNVKTMYGQPMMENMDGGYLKDESKKKKGFKGFFGGNKAGRMA